MRPPVKKIVLFAIVAGLLSFNARANQDPELEARVAVQLKAQQPGAARLQANVAGRAEKLSQQGGVCAATLSQDGQVLHLLVPRFTLEGASYFASFKVVQASDGTFFTTLDGFGETKRSDCFDSDTGIVITPDNKILLHIPSLLLGADRLWVNLENVPTSDGTWLFKVAAAGAGATDVNGEGSAFLSLTQATIVVVDSTQYKVLASFPGGAESETTVSLLTNQAYTPTAEETALATQLGVQAYGVQRITRSIDEATYNFKLQYFVPSSAIAGKQVTMPATRSARAEEKSGIRIVSETVVIKAGADFVKNLVRDYKFNGLPAGGDALTIVGAWFDLKAFFSMATDHVAGEKRLDAVQDCADHPEVPYAQGELQNIQGTINTSRLNVRIDSGLRVLNKVVTLAAKPLKPLAYPVAVIAGLNDDALKTVSGQEIQIAEKRVSCKKSYKASGGGGATFSGTVCDLAKPFLLHALSPDGANVFFFYTPGNSQGTFGTLTYELSGSGVTGHGSGDYKIGPGQNDALSISQNHYGCIDGLPPGLGCKQNADTITLTPIPLCGQ